MDKTFNRIIYYCIVVILCIMIFVSCKTERKYPDSLIKAIDFFYLENHNQEALVELKRTLASHPDKEITQICRIFMAASVCEENNPDSASNLFKQIDPGSFKSDSELMFWYNSMKGLILFRQNQLPQAYSILDRTVLHDEFDNRAIGLNQRIMARICFSLGEYENGIEWLVHSSGHFEKTGMSKSVAINHKILGRYYMTAGNYADALTNFRLAEKGLLKSNDKIELFYIYMNFLDYYLKQKNLDKAKYYANICYTRYKNYPDNQMITLVYNNLGEIDFKQNNYLASIAFFQKTLNQSKDYFSSDFRNINALIGMSKNLKKLGKPTVALRYAHMAQSLASRSALKQMQYEANNNLAQCYRDLKMDKLAYCYLDTSVQYLDSAFRKASLTTKELYDTKVDLVKASSDVKYIRQQEKKQRIILGSIILVLTILIVFGLIIYRLQQSRNKVLKALVKKNLEIIKEERKNQASSQHHLSSRATSRTNTDTEKSELLFARLTSWLETDNKFTQSDLSLEMIAKELNTNREYLSRSINDRKIRFNDLINKYRVEEAIRILAESNKRNSQFKLSYISSKVGFNSNSAFIDAFKKQTGLNPAEFRKNMTATE